MRKQEQTEFWTSRPFFFFFGQFLLERQTLLKLLLLGVGRSVATSEGFAGLALDFDILGLWLYLLASPSPAEEGSHGCSWNLPTRFLKIIVNFCYQQS